MKVHLYLIPPFLFPPRGLKDRVSLPPWGKVRKGVIIKPLFAFFCFFLMIAFPFQLSAQKRNVVFTDITTRSGIDFKYTFGDYNYENILESSGSGITVFDYNNDNLMDLFMMNGTYIEGVSDPGR